MNQKKIMIIAKNLTGGGAERVATNLATCLSKTEDVVLVVLNGENNTYGSTVKTIDLQLPKDKGRTKVLWHYKVFKKVKALKRELGITHSISFMAEPDLANVLSRGKEKVIISIRNKRSASNPTKMHFYKNKIVFSKADAIIALSKMVKVDLVESFGVEEDKITAIYNPCYIDVISQKMTEEVMTKEEKSFFETNRGHIVVTAGRLEPQKGQWHLIRAFKRVVDVLPEAKLIILGQGSEQEYLQTLIKELNLEQNVFMYGFKANPYPYMYHADLFAFPSLFEGLGNILIECMACALPVVSADCQYGPREILAPNTDFSIITEEVTEVEFGILVPPMDGNKYSATNPIAKCEIDLADGIIKMLSDEEKRIMYKNKYRKHGEEFSPDAITKQWQKVINNL